MAKIKSILFIALLCAVYWLPRLYQFDRRLQFRYDQSLHLLESYQMVESKKISLIGPMVTSKTFDGRHFFIGPQYYYLLSVLGLITRWDVVSVTFLSNLIDFIVISLFCFWLSKKHSRSSALLTFLFISFSPYLITHSLFIWNPHWLLPLSLALVYLLTIFAQKPSFLKITLIGLVWGLSFSFHFAAIFMGLPILYIMLKSRQCNFKNSIFLGLFFALGDLPFLVFELRHNFYNLQTMLFIAAHGNHTTDLSPHYFFYPLSGFILFLISLFYVRTRHSKILIVILLLFTLIQFRYLSDLRPLDIIPGWEYPQVISTAKYILKDGCPQNYNIAATMQGDTRFYDLRYILTINNCPPLAVEKYPSAQVLFLVAPNNRPPATETVWEVSSFRPFVISQTIPITSNLTLYKLIHQ